MQIEELIKKYNNGASFEEIEIFEKELNIKLPQDIKELYLKYNGFYTNNFYSILTNLDFDDDELRIQSFTNLKFMRKSILDHRNLLEQYDSIIEVYFVEKKILPLIVTNTEYYEIGVSIDESSKDYGAFFLLPYEAEEDFCKIADNLQDFLSKLKKVED